MSPALMPQDLCEPRSLKGEIPGCRRFISNRTLPRDWQPIGSIERFELPVQVP